MRRRRCAATAVVAAASAAAPAAARPVPPAAGCDQCWNPLCAACCYGDCLRCRDCTGSNASNPGCATCYAVNATTNASCLHSGTGPAGCGGHGCGCELCWAPVPVGDPVVDTALGRLRGVRWGDGEAFYGVRYAAAPRRFDPAEPAAERWAGVRDATVQAPVCHTPSAFPCLTPDPAHNCTWDNVSPAAATAHPQSEDCLFLDVYRPAAPPAAPMAVMVWFHGGGMTVGDSRDHNATQLAAAQGIVVVNVNYRLGPLGFLALPELAARERGGNGGMNGQHDQITALQWVQRHVASFGGDPSRVTVAGASAGSLSTCSLLVSPLARGLFHGVILESGTCLGPWGPGSTAHGYEVGRRAMAGLGVSTVAELRALPAATLMWSQSEDSFDIEFPGYWVDGWVLPDHPNKLLPGGAWNAERVLLGGTSRDGVGTPGAYVPAADYPLTVAAYPGAIARHWRKRNATGGLVPTVRTLPARPPSPVADAVLDGYPLRRFSGNAAAAYTAADGDYNVVCPARALAALAAPRGVDAFLYYFSYGPRCARPYMNETHGWAGHASEQPFVFGEWYVDDGCSFTADEALLSRQVQGYWGAFVRGGAPGGDGRPAWPPFGANGTAMHLTAGGRRGMSAVPRFGYGGGGDAARSVNCALWDRLTRNFQDTDN